MAPALRTAAGAVIERICVAGPVVEQLSSRVLWSPPRGGARRHRNNRAKLFNRYCRSRKVGLSPMDRTEK